MRPESQRNIGWRYTTRRNNGEERRACCIRPICPGPDDRCLGSRCKRVSAWAVAEGRRVHPCVSIQIQCFPGLQTIIHLFQAASLQTFCYCPSSMWKLLKICKERELNWIILVWKNYRKNSNKLIVIKNEEIYNVWGIESNLKVLRYTFTISLSSKWILEATIYLEIYSRCRKYCGHEAYTNNMDNRKSIPYILQ